MVYALSAPRPREERFLVEVRDGVSGVMHWDSSTAHLATSMSGGERISSGACELTSNLSTEKGQLQDRLRNAARQGERRRDYAPEAGRR